MRLFPILGCIALAATGCGGSSPEGLTCEWLAGTDNCWRNTALGASSCLPPDADTGMFSADNATCSYTTGESVSFTPALVLPLPDDPPWNFTVNNVAGEPCLHYEESAAGIQLVVNGQTVSVGNSGFALSITCPDGSSVGTSNAFNLLNCPDGLNGLPGHAIGYTDTSVSFALIGTSTTATSTDSLSLFSCRK